MTQTATARIEPADHDATQRAFRLGERYRDTLDLPVAWNETLDILLGHRSVRAFLSDPLPEGIVETLVAAAQSAASSSNLQPWSAVAVENP